jgi:transposase
MLSLALPVKIYLCVEPTDMRRGFDGLLRMAEEHLARDVLSGGLFVFVNRRRDRLKLLYWDNDGLAIWHKRLEAGRFQLPAVEAGSPRANSVTLTGTQLALILGGIDLASARQRKRYRRPA